MAISGCVEEIFCFHWRFKSQFMFLMLVISFLPRKVRNCPYITSFYSKYSFCVLGHNRVTYNRVVDQFLKITVSHCIGWCVAVCKIIYLIKTVLENLKVLEIPTVYYTVTRVASQNLGIVACVCHSSIFGLETAYKYCPNSSINFVLYNDTTNHA